MCCNDAFIWFVGINLLNHLRSLSLENKDSTVLAFFFLCIGWRSFILLICLLVFILMFESNTQIQCCEHSEHVPQNGMCICWLISGYGSSSWLHNRQHEVIYYVCQNVEILIIFQLYVSAKPLEIRKNRIPLRNYQLFWEIKLYDVMLLYLCVLYL